MNKKITLGFCVCIVLIVIVIAIILFFKQKSEYNLVQDLFFKNAPKYEYYLGDSLASWLNKFDFSTIPGTNPELMLALYDYKANSKGFNFKDIYTEPLKYGLENAEQSIWDIIRPKIVDVMVNDPKWNEYIVEKATYVDSSLNSLVSDGVATMARTFLVPGYKYIINHDNLPIGKRGPGYKDVETQKRAMSIPPLTWVFKKAE